MSEPNGPIADTAADSTEAADTKPRKGALSRVRRVIFTVLMVCYMLAILVSGYWYWAKPVRSDQFVSAYTWWTAIGKIYDLPFPRDERWGG